jgi:hypothetical protein
MAFMSCCLISFTLDIDCKLHDEQFLTASHTTNAVLISLDLTRSMGRQRLEKITLSSLMNS